ncbi:SRPBCC family protein [Actinomadura verrucosospora]|uniref:Cyclase/dehydrase n=1 Tax=Actinomadura verrucosospora TaxID=46165 RepID=A0A7D3W0U8_ACTVE|nr:SRPBCC family protein [Actinomadura verrucosospora]QKG23491.1 cyclase/dehydrase [Actinomadura verrucosospora]
MTFEISLRIHRPPAEVFAYVADFRNMPRWYQAVERVTATTTTATGKGAQFSMVRSLPGGSARNDVEVTAYTPGEEVAFSSTSGPTPFRYHYLIEPIPGGTRLTLNGQISGAGLPGPFANFDKFAEHLFKQGMNKNLNTLKRILHRDAEET